MKRALSVTAVLCACLAPAACGDDEEDTAATTSTTASSSTCPSKSAEADDAYASRFEGDVMMDDKKHVLVVTREGKPVAGASVCVNSAMVGMTSMHYSAKAKDLGDGRYEVPMRFEMKGTYKGNVVTKFGSDDVLVPLTVKVGEGAMSDDGAMDDDDKMSTTTTGAMDHDDEMSKTTSGAMDDEEGK